MNKKKLNWITLNDNEIKKFEGVPEEKITKNGKMSFKDALGILKIPEFEDRIINSNSKGELMHVIQYYELAEVIKNSAYMLEWFPEWFKAVIDVAEKEWKRPESVYQHIGKLFYSHLNTHLQTTK